MTALFWVWVQTVAVCIHVSCHCDHTCLHHCDHACSGPHTIAAMLIHDPFNCELCNCSHYFGCFCLSEKLFSSENCLFSLNIWYIPSYVFFFDISQVTQLLCFLTYLKPLNHYILYHYACCWCLGCVLLFLCYSRIEIIHIIWAILNSDGKNAHQNS